MYNASQNMQTSAHGYCVTCAHHLAKVRALGELWISHNITSYMAQLNIWAFETQIPRTHLLKRQIIHVNVKVTSPGNHPRHNDRH